HYKERISYESQETLFYRTYPAHPFPVHRIGSTYRRYCSKLDRQEKNSCAGRKSHLRAEAEELRRCSLYFSAGPARFPVTSPGQGKVRCLAVRTGLRCAEG